VLKNERILITGATGFIGRHLVYALLEHGYTDLHFLVRRTSDLSLFQGYKVSFVYGDVSDPVSLGRINDRFDIVYHCAGYVSNSDCIRLWRYNVRGTENVCRMALRLGVQRFIYISSVAVVSGHAAVPLTEDLPMRPTRSTYNYSRAKIAAEEIALEFRAKGLPMVIVRPPMVYGEGEPHAIASLMILLRMRLLPLVGGGRARMHMVYVRNLASFLVECLENPAAAGGTFFAADREALTVREVFTALAEGAGLPQPSVVSESLSRFLIGLPFLGKKLAFMTKDRVYDAGRALSLGWVPPFSARDALLRTGAFYSNLSKGTQAGEER
jgi:nucleoside-diphosphate-sugar epimerase